MLKVLLIKTFNIHFILEHINLNVLIQHLKCEEFPSDFIGRVGITKAVEFHKFLLDFKVSKEVIAMKGKRDLTRVPFAGIGLVFGTAIGSGLSIAITRNVLWAGIGTVVGLIVGAIIDAFIKKHQ